MNFLIMAFLALAVSACTPKQLREAWTGYTTRDCDVSEYLSARVENHSGQSVSFTLCSPDVAYSPTPEVAPDSGGSQTFTRTTKEVHTQQSMNRADACSTKGYRPQKVGDQIPFLDQVFQANTQICVRPAMYMDDPSNPGFKNFIDKTFIFISKTQPCPQDSTAFDPATITCKIL